MNLSLQAIMIAATVALTLIVTMGGVIWWQSGKIDRAVEAVAQIKVELSICQANAAARLAALERQNAAVKQMEQEAEERRRAALKARDEALRALDEVSSDYAALRDDWPQDCVSAMARVREELDL